MVSMATSVWPRLGVKSNFPRILRKVNQVISIMYPNSMPAIRILAQAVLKILLKRLLYHTKCQSREKKIIQSQINTEFAKS